MDMTVQTRRLYRWADQASYTTALTALGWQLGPPPGVALLPIGTTSSYYYVDALFTDLPPAAWEAQRVLDTSAPANIPRFARPRPPKGTLHVRDFGVVANGEVDDTAAMQRAVDVAAATGYELDVGDGIILLKPNSTRAFYYNLSDVPVHRCIALPTSPLRIRGSGARFVMTGNGTPSDSRNYMFCTDKNPDAMRTTGHSWEGVVFDFAAQATTVPTPYALGYFSSYGLTVKNCDFVNSTISTRRGWGMTLINANGTALRGLNFRRISQGVNTRYAFNWSISDLDFEDFSEALDFDGVVNGLVATNTKFRRGNQCYDLSSARNVIVTGVDASEVFNIMGLYDKVTTLPTYAEWLAGSAMPFPPTVITSKSVKFTHVNGRNIYYAPETGDDSRPFFIGNNRADDDDGVTATGLAPPDDVQLSAWTLDTCGQSEVREGTNIALRDMLIRNTVHLGSFSGSYALRAQAQTGAAQAFIDSFLSLSMHNFQVVNASAGGVYVAAASKLEIKGLSVSGYNSGDTSSRYGLILPTVKSKGILYDIDGLDIRGGYAGGSNAPVDVQLDDAGSSPVVLRWGSNNFLGSATPINMSGTATMRLFMPRATRPLGKVDLTSVTPQQWVLYSASGRPARVAHTWLIFGTAVSADATNFVEWQLHRLTAAGVYRAINNGSLTAGYAVGQTLAIAPAISAADAYLQDGDSLVLRLVRHGTGAVLGDMGVVTSVLDL